MHMYNVYQHTHTRSVLKTSPVRVHAAKRASENTMMGLAK